MGGSSETGNARTSSITGSLTSGGKPAAGAHVTLVAENYIPTTDSSEALHSSTTDSSGHFTITDIPWGSYYFNAQTTGKKLLSGPFTFTHSETELDPDSLRPTSRITVPVATSDSINFVYVKGTLEPALVKNGFAVIQAAPAGTITIVGAVKTYPVSTTVPKSITIAALFSVNSVPNDTMVVSFAGKNPMIINSTESLEKSVSLQRGLYIDTIVANDPQNRPLTFELITSPLGMQIDTISGIIQWTFTSSTLPAIYRVGVKVTAPDGGADSIKWDLSITDSSEPSRILLSVYPPTTSGDTVWVSATDTMLFTPDMRFRFSWGDGDTSSFFEFPSAQHFYRDTGTFSITMLVTSVNDSSLLLISDSALVAVTSTEFHFPLPEYCSGIAMSTSPDFTQKVPDSIALFESVWIKFDLTYCDSSLRPDVSIDWGDSGTVSFTSDTIFNHAYAAAGKKTIYVATRCSTGPDTMPLWYPVYTITVSTDTLFDRTPPLFTLTGNDTLSFSVNDTFVEPGFSAIDNSDGDVTELVTIESSLSGETDGFVFTKPGSFTITYRVVDSSNNVATATRVLIVVEP